MIHGLTGEESKKSKAKREQEGLILVQVEESFEKVRQDGEESRYLINQP